MENFWEGFVKQAGGEEAAAALGALGLMVGIGVLSGHQSHVAKKIINARYGKDYKPSTFIDKHPKATGAATLGIAPVYSTLMHQKELDRENPRVREVMKKHPVATFGM